MLYHEQKVPVVIALLLVVASFLLQDAAPAVLGRAGSTYITEQEFLRRYELTPGLYRRKAGAEADKQEAMLSLIAEKLLAEGALARGLDADSVYQLAIAELTKLLARDELYRREVREKVEISEQEIRQGLRQARRELRVDFLFFDEEADARFVRSQVKTKADFGRLSADSTLRALRDTATVYWGDADTTIERVAYGLADGEVSQAVKAGDGWYILTIDRSVPNAQFNALSGSVQRERVAASLRLRKERVRTETFVADILRPGLAYSPPATFRTFAEVVGNVFADSSRGAQTQMTPGMAAELKRRSVEIADDTLLVAGSRAWSVDEAIDDLLRKGFVISGDARTRAPKRLYDSFWEWTSQEVLAQEAVRRGLDRSPHVQSALAPWRDQALAAVMKSKLASTITVTDAEVYRYLAVEGAGVTVPEVQLREIRPRSLQEAADVVAALEAGVSFEDAASRWSAPGALRDSKGLTPFFPVTSRGAVGDVAAQLNVGERFGPLKDSSGYVIFEVVGRRGGSPADSAGAERFARGKEKVRRMKQKRIVDLYLAQAGQRSGFELYQDRLRALKVSTIPMMTYRFLGFGGRMFAVPVIEPQLEWLSVDPPLETILP